MDKKNKGLKKLRDKYRLVVYNDLNFEEVFNYRLSRLNLFFLISFSTLFLIVGITLLISFTSLREFIPGYPDGKMRKMIFDNAMLLDSLQHEIRLKEDYLENVNTIISGGVPRDYKNEIDTNIKDEEVVFSRSKEDSVLRMMIEDEERFTLQGTTTKTTRKELKDIHLFPPIKGVVTNQFDRAAGHLGVDIVAPKNEPVKATLDGVVVFATWTIETGYVIQIQHENNILSSYKHNASLLKKVGESVRAGDVISIIGNSGELSTGPHLHFEVWHDGNPINPENYINF
jgi:hypothetical protein